MSTSFPLDGMRVRFAGSTNIGRKRDHNEDSISVPESERLAIVADGMGGHASGEVASRLAVELINDHFSETGKQQTLTWPYKVDRDLRTHINRMVTGMVKDDQIQHVLMSERDVDRAVERLITAANEEGGVDNISVVLARVEVA